MFFLQVRMVLKSETKKKTNESIKRQPLNALKENDDIEEQGLDETVNNVSNSQEAIVIIRRYEEIIKTQNKKSIRYSSKQGKYLKKFKYAEDFSDKVGQNFIYF